MRFIIGRMRIECRCIRERNANIFAIAFWNLEQPNSRTSRSSSAILADLVSFICNIEHIKFVSDWRINNLFNIIMTRRDLDATGVCETLHLVTECASRLGATIWPLYINFEFAWNNPCSIAQKIEMTKDLKMKGDDFDLPNVFWDFALTGDASMTMSCAYSWIWHSLFWIWQ
jgi:hypothetical protein